MRIMLYILPQRKHFDSAKHTLKSFAPDVIRAYVLLISDPDVTAEPDFDQLHLNQKFLNETMDLETLYYFFVTMYRWRMVYRVVISLRATSTIYRCETACSLYT